MDTKILILTYYWPPASGPGVQRILKFVKYLPLYGYSPTIITVKNGSYPSEDHSLLNDIPEETTVVKTKTFEPFRLYNLLRGKKGKSVEVGMGSIKGKKGLFNGIASYVRANYFIPDARAGWNRFAYRKAAELLEKEDYQLVLTSGPPHSTHLIGMKLKKNFGVKWIADFRDPWTSIFYNAYLNRTRKTVKHDLALETEVLQTADLSVVLTKGMLLEFEDRSGNIELIYNGYDPEDFKDPPNLSDVNVHNFTLTYTGNFKENQNIPGLWKAISNAINTIPGFKESFKLVTVGNVNQRVIKDILAHDLKNFWIKKPFVPHLEAIEYMQTASVLLQPIPQTKNNELILTGKMFEYLASGTPILGIGPINGEADKLLAECKRDRIIDYKDHNSMFKALEKYFKLWKEKKGSYKIQNNTHIQYSRIKQTELLAGQMGELLKKDK